MTKTEEQTPPVETPPAGGPAEDGFTPAQEKRLADMLTAALSSRPDSQSAPQRPADGGGSSEPASAAPADLAGFVQGLIDKANNKRDEEDRVAFLEGELDKLRGMIPEAPKQGWGRWILGGVAR